jgi:hypothetical protein
MWWLWIDPPIADSYAINLSDVQVFVEQQQHDVFNLYLIDPMVVQPTPADIVKPHASTPTITLQVPPASPPCSGNRQHDEDSESDDAHAKDQVERLVNQLLSAVKTSGTSKLDELQSVTKKTEYMRWAR